jgi:hypothetical protein
MEQHVLVLIIDYRGQHRKGITIHINTEVNILEKNCFKE